MEKERGAGAGRWSSSTCRCCTTRARTRSCCSSCKHSAQRSGSGKRKGWRDGICLVGERGWARVRGVGRGRVRRGGRVREEETAMRGMGAEAGTAMSTISTTANGNNSIPRSSSANNKRTHPIPSPNPNSKPKPRAHTNHPRPRLQTAPPPLQPRAQVRQRPRRSPTSPTPMRPTVKRAMTTTTGTTPRTTVRTPRLRNGGTRARAAGSASTARAASRSI